MKEMILQTRTGLTIKRDQFKKLKAPLRDEIILDSLLDVVDYHQRSRIHQIVNYFWLSGLSIAIGFITSKLSLGLMG